MALGDRAGLDRRRPPGAVRETPGAPLAMRIAVSALCLAPAACAHHVQLKFPDTSPGAEYTCRGTKSQTENCEPATTIDPAQNNRENTVFVILPRECQRQFNEITIHDSGSSSPTVDVKCSPLENPIQ
jgi:hypothetical protein